MAVMLIACNNKEEKKETVAQEQPEIKELTLTAEQMVNAGVVVGLAKDTMIHATIKVSGEVDVPPQSMISVSFPLGGYLKSSHLLPGMGVKKGEVIATLEDQSYVQLQQDYLMARARMDFLQADQQRQKELSEQDAASKKTYQQALADYRTQQVLIKSLEEKLRIVGIDPEKLNVNNITRTINLRSPINGFVTKVNVNIGKYVNPADVLFELVDPDDIHAALTVYEKDIMHIKKGMKAWVSLADNNSKKYEVDVILVTRNVSESRGGLVHCHFENANHELLPGMFLTGSFELSNQKAFIVPEGAVVRFEGKHFVFIQKGNNNFEIAEVETGVKENGMIEVKAKEGIDWRTQPLVLQNAYNLLGKLKNASEEE
jgi:cobalt-zinc-cadmium efflux system membrane fusion protein